MTQRPPLTPQYKLNTPKGGFSLIELFVVLIIISIIMLTVIPLFSGFTKSTAAMTAAHQLQQAILFAKAEAIKRHRLIRLCASDDQTTCDPNGQWQKGWIIYEDHSNNSSRTLQDPILKVHHGFDHISITKNGLYLTVKLNNYGQISLNRSFFICTIQDNQLAYKITLIHSGQLRLTRPETNCPNA